VHLLERTGRGRAPGWRGKSTPTSPGAGVEALSALAAERYGERVLESACAAEASTLDIARAVGPSGRVGSVRHTRPMLAEDQAREGAGLANVDWQEADSRQQMRGGEKLAGVETRRDVLGDPGWQPSPICARRAARRAHGCCLLAPVAENTLMKVR